VTTTQAGPGVVSVDPFFAKIIANSLAGWLWLAFLDTSCVAPGGSKNICPTVYVRSGP
jgi:hypothetical protein